jgi:CRP-like cAMP-binding protein
MPTSRIHLFDKDRDAVTYPAGHVLFQVGDPGNQMFAVVDGAVDLVIRGQTVETVEAGGILGEMAIIEDKPRVASAVVKSDARVVAIDRKRFQFLVQQNPFFALQLMGIMADRLRRMDERL